MKAILKYTFVGLLAGGLLASCSEDRLETIPTESMSGAGLMLSSGSAMVPLNGIYRSMYTAGWSTVDGGNSHQCFGITAYNLNADVMGEDHIMGAQGSGWFWFDAIYNVKGFYARTTWRPYDLWNAYYTWISNANYILAAEETMEGDDVNYVMGQAYAIRAYSYFMLAQSFARTYVGHESDPGVPIYTEPTSPETKGQPRGTLRETYAQITSDIEKAVQLLNGTTQQDRTHIGYSVAQGIRARIYSVMEDWQKVKEAATEAINKSGRTIQPVSAFQDLNNASAGNVMWGATIITDQVGMYASFFSHMDKESGVSYAGSANKRINAQLYAKMSETDTRLAWWNPSDKYQQEKFHFADVQTWTGDYIWMRVEEMYLTLAEAEVRLGNEAAGKEALMALMSVRDPQYSTNKTGTALGKTSAPEDETGSLLEEIIIQRRIELWGEFGRIYDLRRLHQGFRRTEAQGWPASALLSTRPTDDPECYMWVLTIPQAEFDGNENMTLEADQNPTGDYK